MQIFLKKPLREWELQFEDLTRAYHRLLYVVAVMDTALSVNEIRYLLIARWQSNTDESSLRHRIALAVQQEELKWRRGDRYSLTPDGVKHLHQVEERIRARREGTPRPRYGSQRPRHDSRGPRTRR